MHFHPAVVSVTTEKSYWQIAFADDPRHPTTYLICQNTFEYDDQDRSSGMDSHYVELNDQSLSAYGGVDHVVLWRDRVFFAFTPEVAEMFELPEGLGLSFRVDDATHANLVVLSAKIFGERMRSGGG